MKTWTGDSGKTALFGGEATSKDSLRVDAYGDIDELNSFIGLARSYTEDIEINGILRDIQNDLFIIGSDLAKADNKQKAILTKEHTLKLEVLIGKIESQLWPLTKFILPGGTQAAATLHVARAVCRRCERKVVALKKQELINEEIIKYLNRLSTLLFGLARLVNKKENIRDEEW